MPSFSDAKTGAAITVKVTTRAKKSEVTGLMSDGTVKIRVAAAPESGAANQALIDFLAATLDVSASQIDIIAGLTSNRKLISLTGVKPAEVEAKFRELAEARSAKLRVARLLSNDHKQKKKKASEK